MENFEQWLLSHKLSRLYLDAMGESDRNVSVLLFNVDGKYLLHFTREMLKIYEGLSDVYNDCLQVTDELLQENEKMASDLETYKKIVKSLICLLEYEDE